MTLADFMKLTGKTDAALAHELGLNRSTVTKLRLGKSRPSFKVLMAIDYVSKGQVKAADFVEAA